MASSVSYVAHPLENIAIKEQRLRLEFSAATLLRLLSESRLCASDFRCLDTDSHRCVRKLLLQSCRIKMQSVDTAAKIDFPFNRPWRTP